MILSEKHRLLQKLFREFAENEFTQKLIDRLDATGEFDWDIYNKMAEAGFMGAKIPVKYGGQGGDSLTHVLMLEEFARVSPVLSIYANTSNSLGSGPLLACASEEQLMKYLPGVAAGKSLLAFCLTVKPRQLNVCRARGVRLPWSVTVSTMRLHWLRLT